MAEPLTRIKKARENELFTPGYDCGIWTHVMRDGIVFEDVLKPEYWTSLSGKIGVNTRFNPLVAVVNDEHTFFALLYVRSVQQNQVFVEPILGPFVYGEVETEEDRTLMPKWNVGARHWQVIRKSDRQVVKEGFGVKEQAVEWIDTHLKSVAA